MVSFRKFETPSGAIVLAGKSAENNEELIKQVCPSEIVLHTVNPGSPFINIKGKATKEDIVWSGAVCAKYSQDWRDNKKDVIVHIFRGKDIYKDKKMKTGTFGVKRYEKMKVKKEDIIKFEKSLEK